MEIKVSIIVPFWKVEAFIARCARSLMEQTLQEVEFIFVDDASPDRSAEILREAVAGSGRDVKILSHPVNKGLPAARNTGLSAARGKYVFHCDSDDYLEPAMLEKLYLAAEAARADIAYCDFWLDFGDTRRLMPARGFGDAATMLREGFLAGTLTYNVWNKLARRSLYEGISFPEGHSLGEDMTMMMLASRAGAVVHVAEPLYHYMKTNDGALTTGFSDKALEDLRFNTDRVLDFLGPLDGDWAEFFKLNVKLPFLFTGEKRDWRNWRSWYPEANRFIGRNKALPFRTRMVQHFAALGLRPLVQAYCFLVSKLLYRR